MGVTMMKWILICSIWLAVFVEAQELDFSALRAIAVQKDGRKKPLDTVANETAQRLTGRRKDAMELLLNLWLQARDWRAMPVVLLTHRELKQQLGMPVEQKYFTHEQLAAPALEAIVDRASRKDSHARNGVEREALALAQRMHTLAELARADSLAIVPHSTDGKGAWEPIPDSGPLKERLDAVRAAFLKRDSPALLALSGELDAALRAVSPSLYPSRESLAREVHYNQFHPFRKAEWLYVLAFVLLLASWPARNRAGYWAAVALFAAGVLLHAYGFYLRTMISGRPPITNMYESVVWVSFGAALFALVLEMIFRSRFCLAAVAPIAAVMLLLADMFPAVLDPGIGPLVPVLRSNFWLAVHVPAVWGGGDGARSRHACLLRVQTGGAGDDRSAGAFHLSRDASGRFVAGGWQHPGRHLGALCVGTVLGMGPEGDVVAHLAVELRDSVARSFDRLAARVRPERGERALFPDGVDGVVRGQLHSRQGPSRLRLRHRRHALCRGLCLVGAWHHCRCGL